LNGLLVFIDKPFLNAIISALLMQVSIDVVIAIISVKVRIKRSLF